MPWALLELRCPGPCCTYLPFYEDRPGEKWRGKRRGMRSSWNDLGLSSLWFKSVSYLVKLAVEYLTGLSGKENGFMLEEGLCVERGVSNMSPQKSQLKAWDHQGLRA